VSDAGWDAAREADRVAALLEGRTARGLAYQVVALQDQLAVRDETMAVMREHVALLRGQRDRYLAALEEMAARGNAAPTYADPDYRPQLAESIRQATSTLRTATSRHAASQYRSAQTDRDIGDKGES